MIGRVGRDGFADLALADLKAAGIDLSAVERDAIAAPAARLIPVDRQGGNLIIVASGANHGGRRTPGRRCAARPADGGDAADGGAAGGELAARRARQAPRRARAC